MPDFQAWAPQDWSALAAVTTAAVAVVAAVVAYFQVREARRTREEQARPFVVVDIQPSAVGGNILNLVIENVGRTLARDVKIRFSPALKTARPDYDLNNTALIREGIPTLPPARRIEVLFDVSHERLENDLPKRYEATVSFKDARGRPQEALSYVIDVSYLYGALTVDEYGPHHTAKALRGIEKTLGKWTGRQGRLKVWTRDEDEANKLSQVEHDLTGAYPTLSQEPPPEILMAVGRGVIVRTVVRSVRRWFERRDTSDD